MRHDRPGFARAFLAWLLLLLLLAALLLAGAASAQPLRDELPARVGRMAEVDGRVWMFDAETRRWREAWQNQSITEDDRISTDVESRAQIGIGSTQLRLASDSEVVFERLDDDRIAVRVERGSVAVRVRSAEIARELELLAGPAAVWVQQVGHYRVDQNGATTGVTAWRGSARVRTRDQRLTVGAAQRVELMDDQGRSVVSWSGVERDPFADWVARDEQRDDRAAAGRHVSPEMTGVDDLDRHGRWDRHPEFGLVWVPLRVGAGWAPFRHGRWTWHVRWGWTWVDDAPWGFATSHYGRWLQWHGRWAWVPGHYVARPVYSPAVVAWIGTGGSGVSVSVGVSPGATVGWVPLAPWEVYRPPFRHPPRYYDRVNRPHLRPGVPPQVPTGPIAYGQLGLPQAVTVVPADVLRRNQPVSRAVIEVPPGAVLTPRLSPPVRAEPVSAPPPVRAEPIRPRPPVRAEPVRPLPPALPRGGEGDRDASRSPVVAVPGGALPVAPRDSGAGMPAVTPAVRPAGPGVVRRVDEPPPGLRVATPPPRAPAEAPPPPARVRPPAVAPSPAIPVVPAAPAPRMRHGGEAGDNAAAARDVPQRVERRDGARERGERQ